TDWNGDLIIGRQSGSNIITEKWTDKPQSQAVGLIHIETADMDFGNPAIIDIIDAFTSTYKSSAAQTNPISYALDGTDTWTAISTNFSVAEIWAKYLAEPTAFNCNTIRLRIMNPTVDVLEQRIAGLEGGIAALCVSAGSAAVNYSILNIAVAGDNIVSTPQLYGGTYTLFAHMLPSLGIDVKFADSSDASDIEKLIDDKTKAVFCESIGNPAGNITDLEAIAKAAHSKGIPVIVDNTVATPVLTNPIDYGVDIVVHSLTKYIGGHGTTLGGAIVDSGKFPWEKHKDRFPMMNTPEPAYHGIVYNEAFGPAAYIARARTVALRNTGSALSAMAAFQILQGLETLSLRMERHCDNAIAVAEYLENHKKVSWVQFGGLKSSEYHDLAKKY
ncbi:hypothetical protein LCGC14_2894290, partial [marine sediment metagenome]